MHGTFGYANNRYHAPNIQEAKDTESLKGAKDADLFHYMALNVLPKCLLNRYNICFLLILLTETKHKL